MDWWQAAGLMGTFVATVVGVMALGWRMVENVRRENREAHAKIGEQITGVRKDLGGEIAQVRTDLSAEITGVRTDLSGEIAQVRNDLSGEIAELRQGQTGLLKELGEIRGELTGVTRSVDTLRQDFRAHVLGSAGAGN